MDNTAQSTDKNGINIARGTVLLQNKEKQPSLNTLAKMCGVSTITMKRLNKSNPEMVARIRQGEPMPPIKSRGWQKPIALLGQGIRAVVSMASGDMTIAIETFKTRSGTVKHLIFVNGKFVESTRSLRQAKASAQQRALDFRQDVRNKVTIRLTELMRNKEQKYLRLAADWLQDSSMADDILQDSLIQAINKSWQFDLARNIEPWFTIVLRNQCFMRLRSLKRRGEWIGSDIMEEHEADDEKAEPSVELETNIMHGVFSFKRFDGTIVDVPISKLLAGIPAKQRKLALALWGEGEPPKALIHQYRLTPDQLKAITQNVRAKAAANLARYTEQPN